MIRDKWGRIADAEDIEFLRAGVKQLLMRDGEEGVDWELRMMPCAKLKITRKENEKLGLPWNHTADEVTLTSRLELVILSHYSVSTEDGTRFFGFHANNSQRQWYFMCSKFMSDDVPEFLEFAQQ